MMFLCFFRISCHVASETLRSSISINSILVLVLVLMLVLPVVLVVISHLLHALSDVLETLSNPKTKE